MLRIWSIETKRVIQRDMLETPYVDAADVSSDGAWLCISSHEVYAVYEIRGDVKLLKQFSKYKNGSEAIRFTPDGKGLLVVSSDGTGILWNVETEKEIRRYSFPPSVQALAFSPNGSLLATGTYSGEIDIWNTLTGKNVRTLSKNEFDMFAGPGGQPTVYGLIYSTDGRRLAAARGSSAIVWNVDKGQRIVKWSRLGRMGGVGFADDQGNTLAAAGQK
ncbi:MAG: hypothetical protein GY771_02620, partial [bacterium]|nr:hypothetical protein [bacterium]